MRLSEYAVPHASTDDRNTRAANHKWSCIAVVQFSYHAAGGMALRVTAGHTQCAINS
jgi:hypothetical protein